MLLVDLDRIGNHIARGLSVALAVAVLLPGSALAQADDGTNGVRMGQGRLHLSVGLESRYDSLGWRGTDAGGAFAMSVRPALRYGSETEMLDLGLEASGDGRVYPSHSNLTFFGADAALRAAVNPRGTVGLNVADEFSYGDRITALGLAVGALSARNAVHLGAPVRVSGTNLEIVPGYSFAFERFTPYGGEALVGTDPSDLNYIDHRPSLDVRWGLMPQAALTLTLSGQFRSYAEPGTNPDADALQARLAYSSMLTSKVGVSLGLGYGQTLTDETIEAYAGPTALIEGTWAPIQPLRLKAGYLHTFAPVPQYGWYGDDRLYLGVAAEASRRLAFEVGGGADFLAYAPTVDGADRRNDTVLSARVGLAYEMTRWSELAVGYSLQSRSVDQVNAYDYARHEVFGRVTLQY